VLQCKAGKGKTTALQDKNLKEIGDAQGIACVVNEANMNDIKHLLEETHYEY
jgi:hypothetical protein